MTQDQIDAAVLFVALKREAATRIQSEVVRKRQLAGQPPEAACACGFVASACCCSTCPWCGAELAACRCAE
ncbi:MAG TPA: hypothetical protein VD948_04870 [Rhodothermales bacterium]|nr:hypothetical protein [Rhodothermales bacterium]